MGDGERFAGWAIVEIVDGDEDYVDREHLVGLTAVGRQVVAHRFYDESRCFDHLRCIFFFVRQQEWDFAA